MRQRGLPSSTEGMSLSSPLLTLVASPSRIIDPYSTSTSHNLGMDVDEPLEGEDFEAQVDPNETGQFQAPAPSKYANAPLFAISEPESIGSFSTKGKIFARKIGNEHFRILLFQGSEKLYIRGTADVRSLFGSVSCLGYLLDGEYRTIVSPSASGWLSIETQEEESPVNLKAWFLNHEWSEEEKALGVPPFVEHLTKSGGDELVNSISALVILKRGSCLSSLNMVWDEIVGKAPRWSPSNETLLELDTCELVAEPSMDFQPIVLSNAWKQLAHAEWLSSNPHPPAALVCGKKSVGKSTLMRYLLNVMLARHGKVVLLDLDLGQPELTSPGFVSLSVLKKPLLGPSFANIHLSTPSWSESHFIGSVSAKNQLEPIFNAATMLFARYKHSSEPQFYLNHPLDEENTMEVGVPALRPPDAAGTHVLAPIIINTHGWVEGAGMVQLEQLIRALTPTVLQIAPPGAQSLFSPLYFRDCGVSVHSVRSVAVHANYHSIKSTEKRNLQIVSALGNLRQVYAVPWSSLRIHLIDCEVPPSQIMYVLNGAVVALMVDYTEYTDLIAAPDTEASYPSQEGDAEMVDPTLPMFLLEAPTPMNSRAVGIGLITNIDMQKRCFYISTSLPTSQLAQVNTVIKGSIEMPPSMLLSRAITETPYLTADNVSAAGTGSGNLKVRNNIVRGKAN